MTTRKKMTAKEKDRARRMAWWHDARFGMFVHWGPAAISGEEISWSIIERDERAGQFHKKVPRQEYMNLYKQFNPVKFDADQWLALAKDAGMKYIVVTTRHHDGYCLFDTATHDFNAAKTGPGRNSGLWVVRSRTREPVISAGRTSGVKTSPMFT